MEIADDIIVDLIQGLMVPRSMNVLGTATEAYSKLVSRVMGPRGLVCWPSKEEIMEQIKQRNREDTDPDWEREI